MDSFLFAMWVLLGFSGVFGGQGMIQRSYRNATDLIQDLYWGGWGQKAASEWGLKGDTILRVL